MKKKSKRIATILAVLCLVVAAFPISAFAVTGDEGGATGSTTVTYTASPTYTIEIPSSITNPASGDGQISISCSENGLGAGTLLNVSVDARTFLNDGNFYLVNTSDDSQVIKCSLSYDDTIVSGSRVIRQYRDGSTASALDSPLIIRRSENAPTPGTYTGTIYFSIAVTHTN
jgi:hypothetical protein